MLDSEHQNPPLPTPTPALPGGVIVTPPSTHVTDFPASVAIGGTVLGAVVVLLVSSRFDKTGGVLTVTLLILLAFIGIIAFAVLVTVPRDETTATLVGALSVGFGALIAYWFKTSRNGGGDGAG